MEIVNDPKKRTLYNEQRAGEAKCEISVDDLPATEGEQTAGLHIYSNLAEMSSS